MIDYSLYLVTDRDILNGKNIIEAVEDSIKGGTTLIQLREKDVSSREFYDISWEIKKITKKYNIPLIINDRLDICLATDAEGLHIGQSDLPAKVARKILGNNKILGVSASTLEEAIQAEKDGADYLGVGAVFKTQSKDDARNVSLDELKKIVDAVNIPVVAIGGVTERNIYDLKNTGIKGVAVISAILGAKDIRKASENMLKSMKEIL